MSMLLVLKPPEIPRDVISYISLQLQFCDTKIKLLRVALCELTQPTSPDFPINYARLQTELRMYEELHNSLTEQMEQINAE